ncbi:MAG: 2-amino-4-hydroxy-6-hydroxymethyldihydropteridine diphosphokinase [Candidatus Bipolaricaulia bacterium]
MNRVVISMGSNIQPEAHIKQAKEKIAEQHRIVAESRLVETEPIGYLDQPHFVNGTILIETTMERESLKNWLSQLEGELGRVRTENRYGPRTIDLDIVVWNGELVDPDFCERDFLRDTVLEVWPNFKLVEGCK